ncbi:MAG: tryptophan synthase subunit beta, partial [Candidatus Omnitrophota bacterium]
GLFHPWLSDRCRMIGVEAAGLGLHSGKHAATLTLGTDGVFHGMKSRVLQDADGQIRIAHSISAGLDYPGVGPEHAHLCQVGRVEYKTATDKDALEGMRVLSQTEGIIPALEPAHALGYLVRHRKRFGPKDVVVLCVSGRGDKDMAQVSRRMALE